MELYAATVTSVPFLLLALLADTKLFGPTPPIRHRKRGQADLLLDLFMLTTLAVGFFTSLVGLAMDHPPDMRKWAAYGLGLGAGAVFLHAFARVVHLYRPAARPDRHAEGS